MSPIQQYSVHIVRTLSVSQTVKASLIVGVLLAAGQIPAAGQSDGSVAVPFTFAVSGDSRDCGNIVMPAIAKKVTRDEASFYWHLGDFRAIYKQDEDFKHTAGPLVKNQEYFEKAWDDFIKNQLLPFGTLPIFLVRGNHETIPPKSKEEYISQFADWLNAKSIREQRLMDDPDERALKTYYHWFKGGVDFISLDNSTTDQFDDEQAAWLRGVLDRDRNDKNIRAVVVGMHSVLPDSLADSHSMSDSPIGQLSGRRVYQNLIRLAESAHINVYILASHSSFFMEDVFNTEYWHLHGGVLPGWIIGTAGAERYRLPEDAALAKQAIADVYGYLLATVSPDGKISFEFRRVSEEDVPSDVVVRYSRALVHECFVGNKSTFVP